MPLSVLLIDDDPTFRALARRVLTRSGCDVVGESGNGKEARADAEHLRPDAMLVDVGLPDEDGVALARALAALPWGPRVLIVSVDADATTPLAAQAAGALGFVPKHDLPGAGLSLLIPVP
jgi:DNA-binding NarL/FixJ family response regulator